MSGGGTRWTAAPSKLAGGKTPPQAMLRALAAPEPSANSRLPRATGQAAGTPLKCETTPRLSFGSWRRRTLPCPLRSGVGHSKTRPASLRGRLRRRALPGHASPRCAF